MPPETPEEIWLDLHAHLVPVREELLEEQDGVEWQNGRLIVDGRAVGPSDLFYPERLLTWMQEQHVRQAWVSIPPPVYRQNLAPEAARKWLRYLDDGLKAISSRYPDRLGPLHYLPLEHPVLAAEIATRAIDGGDTRFCIAAGGHERIVYSDPVLGPLWSLLDATSSFVFIHPGHCSDKRLGDFYLSNLVGNPHETAVAVSHLVFGGVCDKYPGIRFCLAHGGGTVPMLAGRLVRGYEESRPGVPVDAIGSPNRALKNFFADCIVHDPQALRMAEHVYGDQHLIFGSDWPFPMGLPDPHELLADVNAATRRNIFQKNARGSLEVGA